jgi:hypothetical protein
MNADEESKEFFKEPKARRVHQIAMEKLKEFTDAELVAIRQRRNENGSNRLGDISRN